MDIERLVSLVSRLFFFGSFVLFALAVVERIANAFGYTVLQQYRGGRLLELAVVLLVFVIAAQLREVKEELKKSRH
jgi:preprotein translocase subunit SecY